MNAIFLLISMQSVFASGPVRNVPPAFAPITNMGAWSSALDRFTDRTYDTITTDPLVKSEIIPAARVFTSDLPRFTEATARALIAAGYSDPQLIAQNKTPDGADISPERMAPYLEKLLPVGVSNMTEALRGERNFRTLQAMVEGVDATSRLLGQYFPNKDAFWTAYMLAYRRGPTENQRKTLEERIAEGVRRLKQS